jgi:hypothetical protein
MYAKETASQTMADETSKPGAVALPDTAARKAELLLRRRFLGLLIAMALLFVG